jgi:hypothetical protein
MISKRIVCGVNRRCERRRVLWRAGKRLPGGKMAWHYFCAEHFDGFMEEHWDALSEFDIERLSDRESDFERVYENEKGEPICQVPRPRPVGALI